MLEGKVFGGFNKQLDSCGSDCGLVVGLGNEEKVIVVVVELGNEEEALEVVVELGKVVTPDVADEVVV